MYPHHAYHQSPLHKLQHELYRLHKPKKHGIGYYMFLYWIVVMTSILALLIYELMIRY